MKPHIMFYSLANYILDETCRTKLHLCDRVANLSQARFPLGENSD